MAIQPGQSKRPQRKQKALKRFPTRAEVEAEEARHADKHVHDSQPPADDHRHEHGAHEHHAFDHFPTEEEVRQEELRRGFVTEDEPADLDLHIERHLLDTLAKAFAPDATEAATRSIFVDPEHTEPPPRNVTVNLRDFVRVIQPSIAVLIRASQRRRVDHRQLSASARTAFNQALQALYADGTYQTLAAVHANMAHNMHTMGTSPVGTQRFLPWHRIYTLQMENLLRSKNPALTIPYWNYAVDRARPDWVWRPPNVTRGVPGAGAVSGSLPSQSTVNNLINNVVGYTQFTRGIEFDAHNQVHNWCNGTITRPATAPRDPIFWLLHANVDRMWDLWQLRRTGVPSLSGTNAILDPWTQTATQANSTVALGYSYA